MIRAILNLYIFVIIIDAILSYFPQFRHHEWARQIRKLANFTLDPVRKLLPRDLPLDFSPLVVIIVIQMIMALW